jgi:DNA-binding GntR family transcriptional regulator
MTLSAERILREGRANRTAAELTFERLKRDVLTGRFAPATRLVERDLTERYGVSRTPLREALKGLVRSQLAVTVPYRGVFVREVSVSFAREVYEMRSGLDGLAGFHAATRATTGQLDRLAELFARIDERSRPVDDARERQARREDILLLNSQFHRTIAEAAHNGFLLEKHDELWISVSLVRSRVWRTDVRTQSSREEHAEILAALAARRPRRARELCERHSSRAWSFVAEAMAGDEADAGQGR